MRVLSLQSCPECQFAFRPRADYLALDFCPRCLAKRGLMIELVRVVGDDTVARRPPVMSPEPSTGARRDATKASSKPAP